MTNKWVFHKIENNKNIAGIIEASASNTTDLEMMEQFSDLTFSSEDNGKIVIIDRKRIDKEHTLATVIITEERPAWGAFTLINKTLCTLQNIIMDIETIALAAVS